MRSSREFTAESAQEIRRLLAETRRSDRARQKRLRDKIRDLGFYISDFGTAFRPEDFDQLIEQGTIRIEQSSRHR
jgi:hypothetical protein